MQEITLETFVQRKIYSFIEAWANVIIGAGVALLSQIVIFPLYEINITLSTNLWLMAWFTLISIIRSYCVRRMFNWVHTNTRWK